MLRMMVGHNLEEEELQAIVEQTFLAADINGDGAIDFNEFKSVCRPRDSFLSYRG